MDFHPPKLKMLVLAFLATGLSAVPVCGQQAGQSIIFSSPQTDIPQPGAPSLVPGNSQPGVLPDTLQAPMQLFNFNPPGDQPPAVVSPADSPQQQRMKKLLDERKNWTLMTPEEILGVATAGKMLQPPELDALGREKNPSQLERYLERENRLRSGVTNGWQNGQDSSPWNFSRDQKINGSQDAGRDGGTAVPRSLGQLLTFQPGRDGFANQNGNDGWNALTQPLTQNQTPAKPDLEQLASMERFRQLLDPDPAPETQPSSDSKYFPVPKPVDPFLTKPDFVPNPAGASFTPLSSGIARPAGLTPLPGVTANFTPPVTAPASRVQPPPWLLQGPQPFVMPQRKF